MKLGQIFQAREAWTRLCQLRMPPRQAYRLLKYAKLVTAEFEVFETQRNALIRELAKAKENEPASIAPETPEYAAFLEGVAKIMDTESDLKPDGQTLSVMLETLVADERNALAVNDLLVLEPFFAAEESEKPKKPEKDKE